MYLFDSQWQMSCFKESPSLGVQREKSVPKITSPPVAVEIHSRCRVFVAAANLQDLLLQRKPFLRILLLKNICRTTRRPLVAKKTSLISGCCLKDNLSSGRYSNTPVVTAAKFARPLVARKAVLISGCCCKDNQSSGRYSNTLKMPCFKRNWTTW